VSRGAGAATVHTVAAAAHVSAQTFSRVLNGTGYVSATTRARVLAAIDQVGYRRNTVGRSLRAARTPTVAFLISDITNPFYARVYRALEPRFRERDLTIMLLNCDDDPQLERRQLEILASYRPTGLIISPAVDSTLNANDLLAFNQTVMISRTIDLPKVPSVVTDEQRAMATATQALIDRGHRRILAVLGLERTTTTINREAGFRAACSETPGVEPIGIYTDQTSAGARRAVRDALTGDACITAVAAFNSQVTEGIFSALWELGISCPTDMSVVGFTDSAWMEFHQPPVSVIAQPVEEMGDLAARLLLDLIDQRPVDPRAHIVSSTLIDRGSIGQAPYAPRRKS